jgi:hypothetical protein
MKVKHLQISSKCPFSCLKCNINSCLTSENIISLIKDQKKNNIFFLYNIVINDVKMQEIINIIKKYNQDIGFFYNGLPVSEYLKYFPDIIVFPLFSIIPEKHNEFIGKKDYYNMISSFNSIPQNIKKAFVFFVNKDNLSEVIDLKGLTFAFKTKIFIQPINFYQENDFDKESWRYLQRIAKSSSIFLLKPANNSMHCKNWNCYPTVLEFLIKKIKNFF